MSLSMYLIISAGQRPRLTLCRLFAADDNTFRFDLGCLAVPVVPLSIELESTLDTLQCIHGYSLQRTTVIAVTYPHRLPKW